MSTPTMFMSLARLITFLAISKLLSACELKARKMQYTSENLAFIETEIHTPENYTDGTGFTAELKGAQIENRMRDAGLVNVKNIDSSIMVEVKYATQNNFVGVNLYGSYDAVYLQPSIARRLKAVQTHLKKVNPDLSLLIYDGTRPRSVQQAMWNALDTVPFKKRILFVSNPKNGSIHNYGCAVDLTLYNKRTSSELDMGAGFDDPRPIAYPKREEYFLSSGELTKKQVENRKLLRSVMRKEGFWVLSTEWWHFNGLTRKEAKEKYVPVE